MILEKAPRTEFIPAGRTLIKGSVDGSVEGAEEGSVDHIGCADHDNHEHHDDDHNMTET